MTSGRESDVQSCAQTDNGNTGVSGERFGEFVRREREAKEIGLREMAKMIGVSPTYLSKVGADEFPPAAENKVKAIAKVINCDAPILHNPWR